MISGVSEELHKTFLLIDSLSGQTDGWLDERKEGWMGVSKNFLGRSRVDRWTQILAQRLLTDKKFFWNGSHAITL